MKQVNNTEEESANNFLEWMEDTIMERSLSDLTRKGHLTMLHAVQRFGKIQTFQDLTSANIRAFDTFIRTEETFTSTGLPIERGPAAIHNYHKRLRSYVNRARKEGYLKNDPYYGFYDDRGEKEGHLRLTPEQVDELKEIRRYTTDAVNAAYLDFFLFQIYTGLGYSDAQQFNFETDVIYKDDQPYLCLKVQRTNKEYLKPLSAEALEILERNDYQLHVSSNQKFNQFLKGVGLALHCPFALTTDVARNTYSQYD